MISRREKNKKIINEIEREKTIKFSKKLTVIFIIIVILVILLFLYMRFIGTSLIKTKERYLYDNIPSSFNGLKIVQISDLLYGSTINDKDLERISNEIKMINPDIIFFTGDLVSNSYNLIKKDNIESFLTNLSAPYGKYAIKGELDKEDFDLIFDKCGFEILNNSTKEIFNKTVDKITIKGLNSNNVETIENTDSYTICLIHNYDYLSNFNTNCDVTFAGHNLGGEIKIPFGSGILGDSKYKGSYYEVGNNQIFISSGLGSKHRLRLFNHPEINVYRIYQKESNN